MNFDGQKSRNSSRQGRDTGLTKETSRGNSNATARRT